MGDQPPSIAIIGAGIFVRLQYISRLSKISDLVVVKAIWSRSEESAKEAVKMADKYFPKVESKWGDAGLDDIIKDSSIVGVAVVLSGQTQVLYNIGIRARLDCFLSCRFFIARCIDPNNSPPG